MNETEFAIIFGEDAIQIAKSNNLVEGSSPQKDYSKAAIFMIKRISAVCPRGSIMELVRGFLKNEPRN